jgi:hypothetical protein
MVARGMERASGDRVVQRPRAPARSAAQDGPADPVAARKYGDRMSDDHVLVNRGSWDEDAPNWIERGREAWARPEPVWGRGNPDSEHRSPPRVSIEQFGIVRRLHAFEISWRKAVRVGRRCRHQRFRVR